MKYSKVTINIIGFISLCAAVSLLVVSFLYPWYEQKSTVTGSTKRFKSGGFIQNRDQFVEFENHQTITSDLMSTVFVSCILSFCFATVSLLFMSCRIFTKNEPFANTSISVSIFLAFIIGMFSFLMLLRLPSALNSDCTKVYNVVLCKEENPSRFYYSNSNFVWGPYMAWYSSLANRATVLLLVSLFCSLEYYVPPKPIEPLVKDGAHL
ncbi:hypothetical protein DFA_03789 [Cavenderia fasciculata]|uniref:Transmembrane protein n=1 Tax=Cavenderia fasciculata TaxID=261658 RepID=F4Q0E4_CACFS|nr:uncharacterized protein DFA_03789 [Cavenderia fasciculata]EGG18295.1 hypothetical protein DFA_03789 [Cavenderia fasciculata]|eukprot:XP_004357118.1 hypothetical protein DFA_03789 [Cavenderia fasciculata]